MQHTRITVTMLLIAGSILLILIGVFLFTLLRSSRNANELDKNSPVNRTIDGQINNPLTSPKVENVESGPADFRDIAIEEQKTSNPDIFVYNKVPFENQYFRIEGVARIEGNPDFAFTVTLKGQDTPTARSKLTEWLTELGLTSPQIAGLLIEYR
ncbi:MAG: hypothetical protein UZ22_OP11002000331 [Microgenomates bacterium OLB23]|nr:MAG: hypothetical protein UZ22_OP11002000331 [Microgenomates bacterium OLB23]